MAEKAQSGKKAVEQSGAAVASAPIDALAEYGGFSFLENIIDGYSNLNPKRKARRNIFLKDTQWESERGTLESRLNIWLDLLKSGKDVEGLRDIAVERSQKADETLNTNLKSALSSTQDLERAYRAVANFYKNTEEDKVKNVTIINASMDQLRDLDNPLFINYVSNELKQNFDRLDLRDNYGILNIPGYLGSNAVLDKWSKIAYDNKAALVTDFEDLESPDDVLEIFANANHTGGDVWKSNTMMTANWLLGRKKR